VARATLRLISHAYRLRVLAERFIQFNKNSNLR
jgi:hypothetical protein